MEKEQISKVYQKCFFDTLKDIVNEVLAKNGFPEGKTISFKGSAYSKNSKQVFWYELEDGEACFRSNMVAGKPRGCYVKDITNIGLLEEIYEKATKMADVYKEQKEAEEWVENGNLCVYRNGWGWKGAGARIITKEKALELLPKYYFGKGFHTLGWTTVDGEKALEFNELSENDMW